MTVVPRGPASVAVELLERDAQMAVLEEGLAQAQEGQGRLVFVSGEAGIGKSALVCRGLDAVRGRDTDVPLRVFADRLP